MSASEDQRKLCTKLYAERDVPAEVRELVEAKAQSLTPREFSKVIDLLFSIPRRSGQIAEGLEEGSVYESEGALFRVQKSRESGRLYAKTLNAQTGRWDYDREAIFRIQQGAEKISFERAVELGMKYNVCIHCSRDLHAEDSVFLAIGPVCAVKHHGVTQSELIARMRTYHEQHEAVSA